jgi:ABC-type phosphate transport system substrate-binding protein
VKKTAIRLAVVGTTLALVGAFVAGPAGATPPTGYGFDDTSHVIVGGGSDTTFFTMQGLTSLWQRSDFGNTGGCTINTAAGTAGVNNCVSNANPETNDLGNYQHDTMAQANPAGSSAGIASLNGVGSYAGTHSGNVDYARSSRAPKATGGAGSCPNELTCDTFWGYAQDGIEIVGFGTHGSELNSLPSTTTALSANELFGIWNCTITQWSQIPELNITANGPDDGPIVPWQMQTSSGTFATFQSFIQNNATGVPAGWSPDGQACDRKLSSGVAPFENDVKPLVNDPAAISSVNTSVDNPTNWMWWSSFGVLATFPFLASPVRGGVTFQTFSAPVNGHLPSASTVLGLTYPIGRTLYHVTKKADADCAKTGTSCDFPGNPGPALPAPLSGNDLNVTGGTTGSSGAVREFTRWLCRPSATDHQVDPFLGTNFFTEITGAISSSGFTVVPSSLRTSGSRCQVLS